MWLNQLYQRWTDRPATNRRPMQHAKRLRRTRLTLEPLEDRLVLTNFTAATVSDLIADINAANQQGGTNTITLTAPTTSPYTLTAVNNTTDGATGLPVIAAHDNLTIVGNGDTIARSTATGTPAFRLLDVATGASLTLQNLTLQGGLAYGAGVSAEGGAVYNQGTLDLKGVTVRNNTAQGRNLATAEGGGIYSSSVLTVEAGTLIQGNQALGGRAPRGGDGGSGLGGGLYIAGGTAKVSNATVSANIVQGAPGGPAPRSGVAGNPGNALGGGLFVSSGTVTLASSSISANTAQGPGEDEGGGLYAFGGKVTLLNDIVTGNSALGAGGGLFIDYYGPLVCMDAFTQGHVTNNTASREPNIDGPYTLC